MIWALSAAVFVLFVMVVFQHKRIAELVAAAEDQHKLNLKQNDINIKLTDGFKVLNDRSSRNRTWLIEMDPGSARRFASSLHVVENRDAGPPNPAA